jgi:4-amino-4-deoxy-L-arabinose transferase-like glycosyltransferase
LHPSTLAKRVPAFLLIVIIAFYFYGLSLLPLVGPDEPRYAQVAREMFMRGDLITPTLGGHTWFEKPVLLYWLMMVGYKLLGVTELAARLGVAISGVLTVLAVFWIGSRVSRGKLELDQFAVWAAIVQATMLGLIVFSRAASFDVLVTMTMTWAIAFFVAHEIESNTRRQLLFLIGFYIFVGLSLLAKGLVGFLPLVVLGAYYLFRTEFPPRRVLVSLLWGIPLALVVAATWYGPVISRHGKLFIDEFIIQHHFARYLSNKYNHPQRAYFYLAILVPLTLPWTPFVVAALASLRVKIRRSVDVLDKLRLLAFAWLLAPTLFFSFSGSKLPGYIIPVLPACALLAAESVTRFVRTQLRSALVTAVALATIVSLVIALNFGADKFARRETTKQMFEVANARGYSNLPVCGLHVVERTMEFYASGRVLYGADGQPVKFEGAQQVIDLVKQRGPVLVLVPIEHVGQLTNLKSMKTEVIANNGVWDLVLVKL